MHFIFPPFLRYWLLPGFVLKKMIMDNFSSEEVDPDIADSTDFLVERVGIKNHLHNLFFTRFWKLLNSVWVISF